ncbi:MAG TPA: hypothetical protein PKX07_04090 [Aggregatilineales bacterium]|nr:hypothetical protein [Aggregatilineales bacterium]
MAGLSDLFRYPAGIGWLVLSGGADPGSLIRAQALRRAEADGGVAYLGVGGQSGDATLEDMEDLGAPTGYHVDILHEDDETLHAQIAAASIIVVDAGAPVSDLLNGLRGAAETAMRVAFELGALLLFEGHSAGIMGQMLFNENGDLIQGLGWLENSLVVALEPGVASPMEYAAVRDALAAQPDLYAIGIALGSGLALGPEGMVEVWGQRQVAIALGRSYDQT